MDGQRTTKATKRADGQSTDDVDGTDEGTDGQMTDDGGAGI